ncbi:MAG: TonB-dependent receptor plug domain-containing protein [Gemmatimonadales bacterium]
MWPRRLRLVRWLALALLALAIPAAAAAQEDTGTLLVTVLRPDSTPLAGAFVRSARRAEVADPAGVATMELPARLVSVLVSHPGFVDRRFEITIVAGVSQRYQVVLDPADGAARPAEVTRGPRDAAGGPMPVTVLGPDRLADAAIGSPTDLVRFLGRVPGLFPSGTGGPLDATRLWSGAVPGRYVTFLVDGLPALGGSPSGFDLRQLAPMEFEQVEWLRGPGTALYGPLAPGDVLNLVPRRPAGEELVVAINQSSEKGGDLGLWGAHRLAPTLTGTVFTDIHQQRQVDADDDGWGEFPRAIRFSIRPRLYLDLPTGDGLSLTTGYLTEERAGGFLLGNATEDPPREERQTRRFDAALQAHRLTGWGEFRLRASTVFQSISHTFEDIRERDRRATVVAEATYTGRRGRAGYLAGVSYTRDALRQREYPAFDYTHRFPSVFGSVSLAASSRLTAELAGRCDDHNVHGSQCVPRFDLWLRPRDAVDLRLFAAVGYSAPTPLTGPAEILGYHALFPIAVRAERTATSGVDLRWRPGPWELGGTLTAVRIAEPVALLPVAGDSLGRLRLKNLDEPTRAVALDLVAERRWPGWSLQGWYGLRVGTEGEPEGTGRRDLTTVPRHQLGAALTWTAPARTGTSVDFGVRYQGAADLADNTFRARSGGFALVDGTITQRSGRARLYFSVENFLDVKLRNFELVVLPTPSALTGRTNLPWAPLRGRVVSLGAQVDWSRR